MTVSKHRVDVSAEMVALIGAGPVGPDKWPVEPVLLRFDGLDESAPTLAFDPLCDLGDGDDADLMLVVAAAACRRIFGFVPGVAQRWHLPSDLRIVVRAICNCTMSGPARETLQLAKSIELLCGVFDHIGRDALVPADGGGALSEGDARRIVEARRMIDEQWHEKLTLDSIARACGLNRSKLTRGFRSMYDCTVTDALTARRLVGALGMLQATDLPVSAIGYRCGYLNNASFTRAFSRRFGLAPTQVRATRAAA